MEKTMHNLEKRLCSEAEVLTNKHPWSYEDLKCASEIVDMMKDIKDTELKCTEIEAMRNYGGNFDEEGYSGRHYGTSYPEWEHNSYRRMRSPSTGQFVSRARMDPDRSMRDGYSGHMDGNPIDILERRLNNAKSEYEREEILAKINSILNDK